MPLERIEDLDQLFLHAMAQHLVTYYKSLTLAFRALERLYADSPHCNWRLRSGSRHCHLAASTQHNSISAIRQQSGFTSQRQH
jgi:hypothetical protein